MSNRLRKKNKDIQIFHRFNGEKGRVRHPLIYKEGYGWVCQQCGYVKEVKEWIGAKT